MRALADGESQTRVVKLVHMPSILITKASFLPVLFVESIDGMLILKIPC
jgi:hypothetical protein